MATANGQQQVSSNQTVVSKTTLQPASPSFTSPVAAPFNTVAPVAHDQSSSTALRAPETLSTSQAESGRVSVAATTSLSAVGGHLQSAAAPNSISLYATPSSFAEQDSQHHPPLIPIVATIVGCMTLVIVVTGVLVLYLKKRKPRPMMQDMSDPYIVVPTSDFCTNPKNQKIGGIGASPASDRCDVSSQTGISPPLGQRIAFKLASGATSATKARSRKHEFTFPDRSQECESFQLTEEHFRGGTAATDWDGSMPHPPRSTCLSTPA